MFDELFCRSLEDKNVEGSADDEGLACEVSEGSLKTPSGHLLFWIKILWFCLAGAKESAVINKRPELLR